MRDDLPPSTATPPQQKPSWLARLVSPFAGYSLLAFMIGMLLFVRIAVSFYEIPSLALAPDR